MPPTLSQFRIEPAREGLIHLVFDCPGRTMNVFSEAAIADLGAFAAWLPDSGVRGVVIRSGKANAFCAGADLTELGVAYDMIMARPPHARFKVAYDHFFRLSLACRALETAGVPVAAAIGGIALGGGCELALAAHYRVLADDPKIGMGLPEALVGLLPGAGGTQRLPRLIGIAASLSILLDGARLGGRPAVEAGLAHALAAPGDEVAAAEDWLLTRPEPIQPWDSDDFSAPSPTDVEAVLAPARERVLGETLGHYPAPLAILDCLAFGLPQGFEGAIRAEMAIFAALIQREEPRNMIASMFMGKTDYDRLARKDALPAWLAPLVEAATAAATREDATLLAQTGMGSGGLPQRRSSAPGLWLDTPAGAQAAAALDRVADAVAAHAAPLDEQQRKLADYAVVRETGFPSYLGGPIAWQRRARD